MIGIMTPLVLVGALALYIAFLRRFDRFKWKAMTAVGAILCAGLIVLDHFTGLGPLWAFGLYVAGLAAFYLMF